MEVRYMQNRVLPRNRQFLTARELQGQGFSHYIINQMVANGNLVKLNNKVYENTAYTGDASDFGYIAAYAPNSVVCLMSAARFYNLTTFLPDGIDIAIERSMKISTIPDWPTFHVWYFSKKRYESGIITASDGTAEFLIYDKEKTVADILFYRNKIGIEETKEIITNYLSLPDRNLNQLHRYAEILGCNKILSTYLEVLL